MMEEIKLTKRIKNDEKNTSSSNTKETALGNLSSAAQSQLVVMEQDKDGESHCPKGKLDVNGQQIDLRKINSWNLHLHDVQTPELAEVFAINTLAPFILNSRLQPLMMRVDDDKGRYVINVSAMEGKFYRHKGPEHPHTNMAKAALNMMTRTCASDLALKHNIYMNSVDTGWINDENPLEKLPAGFIPQGRDMQFTVTVLGNTIAHSFRKIGVEVDFGQQQR